MTYYRFSKINNTRKDACRVLQIGKPMRLVSHPSFAHRAPALQRSRSPSTILYITVSMTVSFRYASCEEIDGLLKTPRKPPLGRRHDQFAHICAGDYVKLPSLAMNHDKMEVSPKGLKQEMSVFSVPVNQGSLIGFDNRRNNDGVVVGLYCEVVGYLEHQDIPFDLPSPSLNIPPTEEVRLRGSFIIRTPLEYIKATAYAYAYAYFDNKRCTWWPL
jgi:hypothetical protein